MRRCGDAIKELDWTGGELIRVLREETIDKKSLVFFTSGNGPWLMFGEHRGSAGPLRDGKGAPGSAGCASGVTTPEMAPTMDLFVTAIKLAGE